LVSPPFQRVIVATLAVALKQRHRLFVGTDLIVHATMLQDLGCEVVTATGASEALDKLSTDRRIEVLITDINYARHGRTRIGESRRADAQTVEGCDLEDERIIIDDKYDARQGTLHDIELQAFLTAERDLWFRFKSIGRDVAAQH
jgi:CheY-like chemotaxis protein